MQSEQDTCTMHFTLSSCISRPLPGIFNDLSLHEMFCVCNRQVKILITGDVEMKSFGGEIRERF